MSARRVRTEVDMCCAHTGCVASHWWARWRTCKDVTYYPGSSHRLLRELCLCGASPSGAPAGGLCGQAVSFCVASSRPSKARQQSPPRGGLFRWRLSRLRELWGFALRLLPALLSAGLLSACCLKGFRGRWSFDSANLCLERGQRQRLGSSALVHTWKRPGYPGRREDWGEGRLKLRCGGDTVMVENSQSFRE